MALKTLIDASSFANRRQEWLDASDQLRTKGRSWYGKIWESLEHYNFVCWLEHQAPWEFEDELLGSLSLPLNIKGNRDHPFARVLTEARIQAIKDAREWPIAVESNQRRKSVE